MDNTVQFPATKLEKNLNNQAKYIAKQYGKKGAFIFTLPYPDEKDPKNRFVHAGCYGLTQDESEILGHLMLTRAKNLGIDSDPDHAA